jgi:hypothetical protein
LPTRRNNSRFGISELKTLTGLTLLGSDHWALGTPPGPM